MPSPVGEEGIISLGEYKSHATRSHNDVVEDHGREDMPTSATEEVGGEPEEGSPEYIRRKYFPSAPADDPSLAWLTSAPHPSTSSDTTPLRFDLTGTPIPPSVSLSLPTHLGLHHHAEGSHAGYTLDELLLLTRSSVSAQRSTVLEVLGRLIRGLGKGEFEIPAASVREHTGEDAQGQRPNGEKEEVRSRILAAGLEAISERGISSVIARGVDIVWACLVFWDQHFPSPSFPAVLKLATLDIFLGQVSTLLRQRVLPAHTHNQLLGVLQYLGCSGASVCTKIVATQGLIQGIMDTFLLTPYPTSDSLDSAVNLNPAALTLLRTLVSSSRENAKSLQGAMNPLLQYITLSPSSQYTSTLFVTLLTGTLRLYTTLANYGLYTNIASTAASYFSALTVNVKETAAEAQSLELVKAWTDLIRAWTVCAIDPHRTDPEHDILWSQVKAWDWAGDVLALRDNIPVPNGDGQGREWGIWAGIWRALAVWLDGSRINGIRGGEGERAELLRMLQPSFGEGKEREVLNVAVENMHSLLDNWKDEWDKLEDFAEVVDGAMKLWVASVPQRYSGGVTGKERPKLESPPFLLPFSMLSSLAAKLVSHSIWQHPNPRIHITRKLSDLLTTYLFLSLSLPGISSDLWVAQALCVLTRMGRGNEEAADGVFQRVVVLLVGEGASKALEPFLRVMVWGGDRKRAGEDDEVEEVTEYVAPLWSTPQSISLATTQIISTETTTHGLPLSSDWYFSPFDHLLRSSTSPVFKNLPSSWDFNETQVVRASLKLARSAMDILSRWKLRDFLIGRGEVVFGCMQVFMLEQGVGTVEGEEVFRDKEVGALMSDLLTPFTYSHLSSTNRDDDTDLDLEKSAARFLGAKTPFYQYYTDFLALYAATFPHPVFFSLLLPPTSQAYALDYRLLLWRDYPSVLKTITVQPNDMLVGRKGLGEWLWPVERDTSMLRAYLGVLKAGGVDGFVRLIAIHHIAANIWPEISPIISGYDEDRAANLLRAVLDMGADVVNEILTYGQDTETPLLPPKCYKIEWRKERKKCIGKLLGDEMRTRLISS